MGKPAVPKSHALTKGKVKTVPKAKALTKGKGMKAKPATKVGFKKSHLAKLGKMTLAQKIRKAAEGCSTAEEAASNLKEMLSKEEHSKVWSKHNCVLKKNQEGAEGICLLDKRRERLASSPAHGQDHSPTVPAGQGGGWAEPDP